jgi:hypothetical protein
VALGRDALLEALSLMERDDWQKAHEIVQVDEDSPLACWAHGITHLMEGDIPNARYWYAEAKREFPEPPSVPREIAAMRQALRPPAKR